MPKGNPEQERLDRLADKAQALAPALDLKRSPNLHVYRALDEEHIMDQATRQRLIPEIKKILHWRERPLSKREDIIEDARRAEARHPKENEDEA